MRTLNYILLAVAEKLGLDLKLEVGAVTESVTVRGDASLIETESASRAYQSTLRVTYITIASTMKSAIAPMNRA